MTRAPEERGKRKPAGRGERLAAALRENLRRRKMQARGRHAHPDERSGNEPKPHGKREP